ncbi:hypothetical protein RND71_041032 [Anisodus tanguticus]|uniref:Uncharacterized protein n=1 Tax=Anisodus tanguticus TaxID=243964 RepID=A0AAE1QU08_9SOLA|nr:hypothetical protein RND71_041032 [Anisodus tanguticus]
MVQDSQERRPSSAPSHHVIILHLRPNYLSFPRRGNAPEVSFSGDTKGRRSGLGLAPTASLVGAAQAERRADLAAKPAIILDRKGTEVKKEEMNGAVVEVLAA